MLVRPVSGQPAPPADPVTAEDGYYAAVVDEFRGLRRAGAGIADAALLTAAYRLMVTRVNAAEATATPG